MESAQTPEELRPAIADYLRRFVQRRRNVAAVRACAAAFLVAMLWLLAWSVVDRFFAAPAFVRLAMLLCLIAVIVAMVKMPLIALFRRKIDWRQAAEQLEDRDPRFNEMLVTIVSQSLSQSPARASTELMARLVEAAESRISVSDSRAAVPLGPAIVAVVFCFCGAVLLAGLCAWPWLGLPHLLQRQIQPLAAIPPVTTTRIAVQVGSVDVIQGRAFSITAKAEPLLGTTVLLRTSTDGQSWTNIGMAPNPDGTFGYKFPSVSRDFAYQIAAGDALVGPFKVRVLRQPLVREFRIRLNYPSYINRSDLLFTNADGTIEAPAGTQAEVTVVASEPLKSAAMVIDHQRIEMSPTADAKGRKAVITIAKDAHWTLEMISEQDVAGAGPSDMTIRSIPDRSPIARLLLPQGIALLQPRDTQRIPFQAADDYALASLVAEIAVEGKKPQEIPLKIGVDPRRVDDLFSLDLAQFNVTVGQIVTLSLIATDRAGQRGVSAPARILISPRAIDPYERRRLEDFKDAVRLSKRVGNDLAGAEHNLADPPIAAAKAASAAESAALLARSLLRASVGINQRQRALMMAALMDTAQLQASRLEAINSRNSTESIESQRAKLQVLQEATNRLATTISDLWVGLSADVILLELENVAAVQNRADPKITQLRQEIATDISALGLSDAAPDNDSALRQRSQVAAKIIDTTVPIDFVDAANQWARTAQPQAEFYSDRLATASQVEAVRRDADLVWARDLQLAARAARGIDQSIRSLEQIALNSDLRSEYPHMLAAMSLEHDMRLRGLSSTTAPADSAGPSTEIHSAADAARAQMAKWAGENESNVIVNLADAAAEQSSALEANALVAQKQYDKAQALDRQLFRDAPQTRVEVEAELKRAREIDALDQQQAILNEQSFHAGEANLAAKQAELNERVRAIQQADHSSPPEIDSRERGLAAVRRVQEGLGDLPQKLARIEQLAADVREARDTAQHAASDADVAPEQIRAQLLDEVAATKASLEQSLQVFKNTGQAIGVERIAQLTKDLRGFTPEAQEAVNSLDRYLVPGMERLLDLVGRGDAVSAPRAVADVRRALITVQEGLRSARQALLERDPLVAARWFAQEAATFFAEGNSNQAQISEAQRAQLETDNALRRAWDDSIHRLAEARLAGTKAMGSVLRTYGTETPGETITQGTDWNRFRRWRDEDPITSPGETIPPGYQDALRAYFKVLDARSALKGPQPQ